MLQRRKYHVDKTEGVEVKVDRGLTLTSFKEEHALSPLLRF